MLIKSPTVCSTSSVCVSKSSHSRNECWRNRMLSADMCHSVIGATHPAGCCRHTGAQTNFTLTNTNIQQTHTPKYTHTQTLRSARITVRAVHTSWLSNPWTCANNFLSPGKGEGRRSKIKKKKKLQKMMGTIPFVYLYGTSLLRGNEWKKKGLYTLLHCRDDRFTASIK